MLPDPQTLGATFNAVRGVLTQFSDATWKAAIIDLQNLLMSLQGQAMELQHELHTARMRVRELETQLAVKNADPCEGLTFDRQAYWASASREHGPDGPFCAQCLDRGDGRRRLLPQQHIGYCTECKRGYSVWPEKYKPPPLNQRRTVWDSGY
jgi:hypothetical protein